MQFKKIIYCVIYYTVSSKNVHLLFFNNSVKINRFLMIFGMINSKKIWHETLTGLSTEPVRCNYFTLGNPKKSFSTVLFIHTYDYLRYFRRKQIIIHVPTPPENVTTPTCELQNFFYLTEGLLDSFKRWRLWKEPVVDCSLWLWKEPKVMCGNWNVRQAMSQQVFRVITFCVNVCFQSFFDTDQSHSTPRYAEIQPMSQQAAAASLNYMSISIHALLL